MPPGRHFLQIPGPTNLPERVAHALARTTIDHRGPQFARLTTSLLDRLGQVFATEQPVIVYPSSGSGGWEAALANTVSPGDRILFCINGHFATKWRDVAQRMGLQVESLEGAWHLPVNAAALEEHLAQDDDRGIRAVCLVHNETSTGVVNDVAAMRAALDGADHPALLLVDAVSSLGAMVYEHDAWGVDATVAGSQKGLMLPPGLGFNAISARALASHRAASFPRSYWDWTPMLEFNQRGFFPYTPSTNLLFGLDAALDMLLEEGLDDAFARHERHATTTRQAVQAWGLQTVCRDPGAHSQTLTAVEMPAGHDADALRQIILDRFDMSLGTGLGPLKGRVFRIGHLGDFNDLMLAGTLCGVEMGLALAGVPHERGGVEAAMSYLISNEKAVSGKQ